jgi:hypothetical protein
MKVVRPHMKFVEMLRVLFSPCPEELDFFFDERFFLQFGSGGGCVAQV